LWGKRIVVFAKNEGKILKINMLPAWLPVSASAKQARLPGIAGVDVVFI
jgi:hypothetical protein